MNKIQWQSVGESEHLKLAIFTLEVNPLIGKLTSVNTLKGKWTSFILVGDDEDCGAHSLDSNYNHPTREDAKNYVIAKARELLLADLKQLET